jgi:two-component system sensor histidine kinase MprB
VSLRHRIAALTAGAVAIAVLLVTIGAWFLVRNELRQQVDETLFRRGRDGPRADSLRRPGPPGGGVSLFDFNLETAQVISASGEVELTSVEDAVLPVSDRDRAVAAGAERPYLHDERVNGVHYRVLTAPLPGRRAVLVARDLTEVDATLRGFTVVMVLLSAAGVAGAALAGMVVARRAIAPVEKLTGAAEHVAKTKDLSATIDVDSTDELGRLGGSFNEMLTALSESREQQRRLVADASHELRTPLTSLRTNVEVLAREPKMSAAERTRLLSDLSSETSELTALVDELVALATEQRSDDEEVAEVQLDAVVAAAVDRTRRRSGRTVVVTSVPSIVQGRPLAIERAVSNLLDNAVKWGPEGETIDVRVEGGLVEVRDRGPGIAAEDRPKIFDRFYRATSARSMPGSGLGLSIVKQVAESHGGRVWATQPGEGPGAVVGFELPTP